MYSIEHRDSKKIGKRHAAHLSPFPHNLLPFVPVDGPDNQYGQIHTPIGKDPYYNSGIKGFNPSEPYKTHTVSFKSTDTTSPIHFPTLAELNSELFEWEEGKEDRLFSDNSLCSHVEIFSVAVTLSPPQPSEPVAITIPTLGPLTARLYASSDKLFFIMHRLPGSSAVEWTLVRIDLSASLKGHPSALQH